LPGVTKRKYDGETMRINKKLKRPLYIVAQILPPNYNAKVLLDNFKEFYPFEWEEIVERCNHYLEKDKFLQEVGKKERYRPPTPEKFFYENSVVKNIMSKNFIEKHSAEYDDEKRNEILNELKAKRSRKIESKKNQIQEVQESMQNVEPYYVDVLISAYHQKGITTEGKIEILTEMGKFICDKSIEFFHKINDAERNNQIRNIAFEHLQKNGHYVKLRQKFKGKQKSYMVDTFNFDMTPKDLAKRLEMDSIQNKKRFGVFVSHRFLDAKIVREVVKILNAQGLSCYCDWLSDDDFLKRSLVSSYTEEVLKKRLEQSDTLLFLRTENSMKDNKIDSPWIQLELDHCSVLGKKIYCLDFINDGTSLPFTFLEFDLDKGLIDWSR